MENFKKKYQRKLVLASFSGTIANTEELSLGKENLYSVYRLAITQMFGERGEYLLWQRGGIGNINYIQKLFFELLADKICVSHVCQYLGIHSYNLYKEDPISIVFQEFTKLSIKLLKNVVGTLTSNGEVWPNIYTGFSKFRSSLKSGQIDLGIISSGFSEFINSVFDKSQIDRPEFCVTLDDRIENLSISWESKVKPSPMLIANAIEQWSRLHFKCGMNMEYALANTVLIGDDLELDGKMAEAFNLPFWYFTSDVNNFVLSEHPRIHPFSNWGQLTNALKEGKLFT